MIVAIHQPHFLPWLGYLHRMARADVFVILDHVQFERRNYQNRSMILLDGEARWLSVPVVQRSQKERIDEKLLDNRDEGGRCWGHNHARTVRHAYREAPFLHEHIGELKRIFESTWQRLVDLNDATLAFMREAFGIRTPLVRSSTLGVDGAKAELILQVCKAVGARTLLAGLGGSRGYLDEAAFRGEGIGIVRHDFRHPVYPQIGAKSFVPGLAAIDMLFHCGPQSRELLFGGAAAHERVAA